MPIAVRRDLAGVSAGRFVWAPSRRHIYFEGRAGDTQNVWRITVDPVTETWVDGPERLTTGAGEETNVGAFAGRHESWSSRRRRAERGCGRSRSTRPAAVVTGEPYPISNGSTGEVDFDARADGSKVAYRTVRAGRSELWERSIGEGQERLLLSSTDWRIAKPRWSPDGARLAFSRCATRGTAPARRRAAEHGRQRRARVDEARPGRNAGLRLVEGRPGDPRRLSVQSSPSATRRA